MKKRLTYQKSGVNIDEGEKTVRLIAPLAKKTHTKGVISEIGGFGALFSGKFKGMKDPVLVSGTDGVGTKLKLAFMANKHDTVGIDLVAMCVNDIITAGAKPLFFLDYLATGKLKAKEAASIISGIATGCKASGSALIGGETAEMPGMYSKGEYDLAGFSVGVVDKKSIITGTSIRSGDAIIGLHSSGLHSNGFSLARKVIFDSLKLKKNSRVKGLRKPIAEELLTPTRIYVNPVLELLKKVNVSGIIHVTGGGFYENIPRILPKNVRAVINKGSWKVPKIFDIIASGGNISEKEMFRTFNMGIGMILIVKNKDKDRALGILKKHKERPKVIGKIEKKRKNDSPVELI